MAETHRRFVGVDFRSVPASDIPAVLERLAAAGWTWEEERWMTIFAKAFADKFFPGEDPVGKRIEPAATSGAGGTKMHQIVGVVGSVKLSASSTEAAPFYYFSYKQLPCQPPPVVVRAMVAPRNLESAVREQMAAGAPA